MKSASESALSRAYIPSLDLWLRTLRVRDWFYLVGIAGLALARRLDVLDVMTVVRVVGFSSVYLCWGYVFNNSLDQHEDSNKKNPFRTSEPLLVAVVTLALTVGLAVMAFAWELALATSLVMGLNFIYSAPPFRLKRLLVPSLLCNGVFFGFVYYAAVRLTDSVFTAGDVAYLVFVFVMFLPLQFVHHLEHREEAGFATARGERGAAIALFTSVAVVAVCAWFNGVTELAVPSSVYSLGGMWVVSRNESASRARIELRWWSALFGVVLLLSLVLK